MKQWLTAFACCGLLFFLYQCGKLFGPSIISTTPTNGATDVAVGTSISVTFNLEMNPATLTSNTADSSCSGSIQLSSDSFSTCVQMSAAPTASNNNRTFTVNPASDLTGSTNYSLRFTSFIKDESGKALTQTTYSFTTVTTSITGHAYLYTTANQYDGDLVTESGEANARAGADALCALAANVPDEIDSSVTVHRAILTIDANDAINQMYDNYTWPTGTVRSGDNASQLATSVENVFNGTSLEADYWSSSTRIWAGQSGASCGTVSSDTCSGWTSNAGFPLPEGRTHRIDAETSQGICSISFTTNFCNADNYLLCIAY